MKIALAVFLLFVVAGGTFYLWTLLDKNNKQVLAGAQKCYEQGENFLNQKNYKAALLSYEEVTEFYSRPRTQWADLAEEKEWICRAYLNDWISAKGKWNGDLRELKPHDYEKYKAVLIVITPIVEGAGNTMTHVALTQTPVLTTTAESSAPTPSLTMAPAASPQIPVVTMTAVDPTQTPNMTTAPVDPNQTPTFTATPVGLTPTPSPGT